MFQDKYGTIFISFFEAFVMFWLTVYTFMYLWHFHDLPINPLSYGIMEIVMLALMAGWIDKVAEIKEIWDDLPD